MAIHIDESFEVQASPDQVWAFLIVPARVVHCLPGAELLSSEDERTFTGRIRIKVGPVVASYRGRVRFDEIDADALRVRMSGEGQETAGGGAAKMRMMSVVSPLPDGGAHVRVESEIDVVGKLVQFGRGMIDEVSRQLFRQFADCARSQIESAAAPPLDDATTDALESSASGAAVQPESAPTAPAGSAPVGMPALERAAPPPSTTPLRLLPLLWSAIRKRLGRLLRLSP
jgi:carbon monoxide dehydrogenase subunit G